MECIKCNGKTKVTDIAHLDGIVYRRRKCLNCGESFKSREYLTNVFELEHCNQAFTYKHKKTICRKKVAANE